MLNSEKRRKKHRCINEKKTEKSTECALKLWAITTGDWPVDQKMFSCKEIQIFWMCLFFALFSICLSLCFCSAFSFDTSLSWKKWWLFMFKSDVSFFFRLVVVHVIKCENVWMYRYQIDQKLKRSRKIHSKLHMNTIIKTTLNHWAE